jgi:hypothetical protein
MSQLPLFDLLLQVQLPKRGVMHRVVSDFETNALNGPQVIPTG